MMDPVTALSLACNVLQLVDQAIDAAAACKQIYDTGSLPENDSIEDFAIQVTAANTELKNELVNAKQSPRDARLRALAQDAIKTADELKLILSKIKYVKQQKGTLRAAQQSLRTLLARGRIEKLQSQLTVQEAKLQSGLLKDLYVRCVQNESTHTQFYARLSQTQQDIVQKVVNQSNILSQNIIDKIDATSVQLVSRSVQSTNEILSSIDTARDAILESQTLQRLLEGLRFDDMCQRQNDIARRVDEFGKSFRWILHPVESKKHTFIDWLREESGIFWINGKPGSGKSTILDFLQQQLQTDTDTIARRHLRHWATPERPIVISFFIYSATTSRLQGSFEGFWRSFCHQLLSQVPSLIRTIATDMSAPSSLRSRASPSSFASPIWLLRDLKSTFLYLLQQSLTQGKVLILLDGLDEFQDDQEQLVRHLQSLVKFGSGLKVCCSSRPENLFVATLSHYPTIRLQDFTFDDILDHCQRTLKDTNANFLSRNVATTADGVFLWAYVVSSDLVRGARCDATDEELRERLGQLPTGMAALFTHMISKIDPFYLKNPLPYLNVFLQNTECTLLELTIATFDEEILDTMLENGVDESMITEIDQKCRDSTNGIVARCGGLIELCHEHNPPAHKDCSWDSLHVHVRRARYCRAMFIHRTAKDFLLEDPDGQRFIARHSFSNHEALLRMAKAKLATIHLCQSNHLRKPEELCSVSHMNDITRFISAVSKFHVAGGAFSEAAKLLDQSQKILNVVTPMNQGLDSEKLDSSQHHTSIRLRSRVLTPEMSYAQNFFFIVLISKPNLQEYIMKKLLETAPSLRPALATSIFLLCLMSREADAGAGMHFSLLASKVLDHCCDPNIRTEIDQYPRQQWSQQGVTSLWARFLTCWVIPAVGKKLRRESRTWVMLPLQYDVVNNNLSSIAHRFLLSGADATTMLQVELNRRRVPLHQRRNFDNRDFVRVEETSENLDEEKASMGQCTYVTEWDVPSILSLIEYEFAILDATRTTGSQEIGYPIFRKGSPLGTKRFFEVSLEQSSELFSRSRPWNLFQDFDDFISQPLITEFTVHQKILLANKNSMDVSDIETLQRYGWNLELVIPSFAREGPSELELCVALSQFSQMADVAERVI